MAKEGEVKKQGRRSRYPKEVGECGLKVPKGHPKETTGTQVGSQGSKR